MGGGEGVRATSAMASQDASPGHARRGPPVRSSLSRPPGANWWNCSPRVAAAALAPTGPGWLAWPLPPVRTALQAPSPALPAGWQLAGSSARSPPRGSTNPWPFWPRDCSSASVGSRGVKECWNGWERGGRRRKRRCRGETRQQQRQQPKTARCSGPISLPPFSPPGSLLPSRDSRQDVRWVRPFWGLSPARTPRARLGAPPFLAPPAHVLQAQMPHGNGSGRAEEPLRGTMAGCGALRCPWDGDWGGREGGSWVVGWMRGKGTGEVRRKARQGCLHRGLSGEAKS